MDLSSKNPCRLIKLDKYTGRIERPTLRLLTKTYQPIGGIPHYSDWNFSFNGNVLDEISFTVHKYVNEVKCPVWDELIDLKTVEVVGYGMFEIHVSLDEETESIKTVTGQSMEVELGQIPLRDFHVNDEVALSMVKTDYNADDFDSGGNFIPTVFHNPNDIKHSLLHRALADKAPHWSIGYVTPYVVKDKDEIAELSSEFQREYTEDGTTIYDFFTGTVATETNVVFIFDTYNREVNVYSLYDCYDENGALLVSAIGEDTTILISKNKLASQITISSNADSVKNCFYVTGGDDIITSRVAAINMSGDNYIYRFADWQLNDMPENLKQGIIDYAEEMANHEDEYYGENGIYTSLTKAYEELLYLESEMMPDVELTDPPGAEAEFARVCEMLESTTVGVYDTNNYSNALYSGITNNIESYASVLADPRYNVEIIKGVGTPTYNADNKQWTGVLKFTRAVDDTDTYPTETDVEELIENYSIVIDVAEDDDNAIPYTEQKIYKALKTADISNENFLVENMTRSEKETYFSEYSLNRLKAFQSGYDACLSVLCETNNVNTEDVTVEIHDKYKELYDIVTAELNVRQEQVGNKRKEIETLEKQQKEFHDTYNLKTFLENIETGLYEKFASYRREDEYNNSNYISDSLTSDSEINKKAKELLDVAKKEIRKACVLQRSISTNIGNLLVLPEFESLYEKFALFNYIRVKSDDELFKLRLTNISFSDEDISNLNITFAENVETITGGGNNAIDDVKSILQQASSIATSYSSTLRQAEQGSQAHNTFNEIYTNGLNAVNFMLKNSNNNEITMTQAGLLCKRMDDENIYSPKQLRLIGNGIYMTDDNWNSVRMAVGEALITDPDTNTSSWRYGIIAEALVGRLIVGEKLMITSGDNGYVRITGDGIVINKGTLNIQNGADGRSVIIDPLATLETDPIFKITDKNGNIKVRIMPDGDAELNDIVLNNIDAQSGKIGKWDIVGNSLICKDFDNSARIEWEDNRYHTTLSRDYMEIKQIDLNPETPDVLIYRVSDIDLVYYGTEVDIQTQDDINIKSGTGNVFVNDKRIVTSESGHKIHFRWNGTNILVDIDGHEGMKVI